MSDKQKEAVQMGPFAVGYDIDSSGRLTPILVPIPTADERTSHPKGSDSLDSTSKRDS